MGTVVSLWPLIGVVVIIAGFILRFSPILVVAVTVIATSFAASMSIERVLTAVGMGIVEARTLPLVILLPLTVVGLLKRHGLRKHAQNWVTHIQSATIGRLLIVYLAVRELAATADLTSLGGRPQMVRPLLAPIAEGAAGNRFDELPAPMCEHLLAFCTVTDNVGLLFGGDIFVAFGVIALIHTFLPGSGIGVRPPRIAVWGIPTAVCAFLIHSVRLKRLDGWLAHEMGNQRDATGNTNTATAKQG